MRTSLNRFQQKGENVAQQLGRIHKKGQFTSNDLKNLGAFYDWLHSLTVVARGYCETVGSLLASEFKRVEKLPLEKQGRRIRLVARELGRLSFIRGTSGESPTLAELLPKDVLLRERSNHTYSNPFEPDPDGANNTSGKTMFMMPFPDRLRAPSLRELLAVYNPKSPVEQPEGDPPKGGIRFRRGNDWWYLFGLWHGSAYTSARITGYDSSGYFEQPLVVDSLRVFMHYTGWPGYLLGNCGFFTVSLARQDPVSKVENNVDEVSVSNTVYAPLHLSQLGLVSFHEWWCGSWGEDKDIHDHIYYCDGAWRTVNQMPYERWELNVKPSPY
jgi:hypothetical protein